MENKKSENKEKKNHSTLILFIVAMILLIFYLILPSKNNIKKIEEKENKKISKKIKDKEKTSEEILKEELNKILINSTENNVKIAKIYFSGNILYIETNNKIKEELTKEKLLTRVKEKLSITRLKFIEE